MDVGRSSAPRDVRSAGRRGRPADVGIRNQNPFFDVIDVTTEPQPEQPHRERECVHRHTGAGGAFYPGEQFVSALQRMRGGAAVELARKVGAFFWSDAPRVRVWLCHDCAREASLARPDILKADAA
jgi:hypothetical protein